MSVSAPPTTLATVEGVTRVAYLLELQDKGDDTAYVFAEMDSFAETSDALVLRAEPKPADQRAAVAHLRVRANTEKLPAAVGSGDGNGFVEFYGSNYTAGTLDTPAGGDANKYDFNDKPVPDAVQGLGYGCLQVHDLATKTTVLAFNHFNSSSLPCDVGIGKCAGEHPDWTFARNGGAYKARRLSVWVK